MNWLKNIERLSMLLFIYSIEFDLSECKKVKSTFIPLQISIGPHAKNNT